jgi:hypothetical protein
LYVVALLTLLPPAFAAAPPSAPAAATVPAPFGWLPEYEALSSALVADDAPAATTAARALSALPGDAELSGAATAVAEAADPAARRTAFGQLSRLVVLRLSADPQPPHVVVYHCPMFQGYAYWIQPKLGIADPYMGQAMPDCGEEVSLKVAAKAAR